MRPDPPKAGGMAGWDLSRRDRDYEARHDKLTTGVAFLN
jgi:hypothetical protein